MLTLFYSKHYKYIVLNENGCDIAILNGFADEAETIV